MLKDLIEHFSALSLGNALAESDVLGDAYEYLIKKFADATNKKAGEFYTPRSIVRLMVDMLDPKPGERVYDPACGTGGMRPDVRARRIKTIGAEQRKFQREIAECEHLGGGWARLTDPQSITRGGEPITFAERVRFLAGRGIGCRYELAQELDGGKITPEQAQANVVAFFERRKAHLQRWVAHCDNRLAYERATLDASGYVPPPKPKTKADLPLLNYSGAVAYRNPYRTGEIVRTVAVAMTKAELAKIPNDYKGTRMSECGTHRLRYALVGRGKPGYGGDYGIVYLTDSKQHPRPAGVEARS